MSAIIVRASVRAVALIAVLSTSPAVAEDAAIGSVEDLGKALFFDTDLSLTRTQACATCHNPDTGFADPSGAAASLGADGRSLGDRNAPTASYARFSPDFRIDANGKAIGGQFHDGRAATLAEQAGGPPLNPGEMAMPSKAAVLERLREKPAYVEAFGRFYGAAVLDDAERAYGAMTASIAAFERTDTFSPFDSKYDRYLRGEYKMSPDEELGMTLFFSTQFTNCHLCHQLKTLPASEGETFTNYEYFNIGVPVNTALRQENGVGAGTIDRGLRANPGVTDDAQEGKFKTPTLRNVAVTGPYMHNGVFRDLETVIRFYNSYNATSDSSRINPETGAPWGPPEVGKTIALKELETGPALDTRRIKALVAFLKTLTDARYENLIR